MFSIRRRIRASSRSYFSSQPRPTYDAFPTDLTSHVRKPIPSKQSDGDPVTVKRTLHRPPPPRISMPTDTGLPLKSFAAAHQLALETSPHRLLCRDFIHDALYNPTYGYFSKRAVIFSAPQPIDFQHLESMDAFHDGVGRMYAHYDAHMCEKEDGELEPAQVWHTPTELFKPYYGEAIARYIVQRHEKERATPSEPLIVFEMGAGNGTLLNNICDYIRKHHADIYAHMQYNVIEISRQLTEEQRYQNLNVDQKQAFQRHPCVRIIHKSIFDYDKVHVEQCFFIALEVIDNFAHDAVRYNLNPTAELPWLAPLETHVTYDPKLKHYEEEFEPVHDALIQRYLRLRDQTSYTSPLKRPSFWARCRQHFPLAPNVTAPEFIPTMQMYFMERLNANFPRHRLILSDFDHLPTEVEGVDAPVVQTRQRGMMVPCSTYLVSKGWFDIFFPTQFELMRDMYALITASSKLKRQPHVLSHRQFLETFGHVQATRTLSGENPMLENYQNMKFLLT